MPEMRRRALSISTPGTIESADAVSGGTADAVVGASRSALMALAAGGGFTPPVPPRPVATTTAAATAPAAPAVERIAIRFLLIARLWQSHGRLARNVVQTLVRRSVGEVVLALRLRRIRGEMGSGGRVGVEGVLV